MARRSGERISLIRDIGGIIADRLDSEHLSQRAWSQRIGLSQSTVSRLLSGEQTSLTGPDLERLAIGLRRSVASLIRLDDPDPDPSAGEATGRMGWLAGGIWDPNRLDLDRWAATLESRRQLPELVYRLILATVPWRDLGQPRFLLRDDAERKGWDGAVTCGLGGPFVPVGPSLWEFSVQSDARNKAGKDLAAAHKKCAAEGRLPADVTVVFVTPQLWGSAPPTSAVWASAQCRKHGFRDVRVIDRPQLLHWLDAAPVVRHWFAKLIGSPFADDGLSSPDDFEKRWQDQSVFDDARALVLPLAAVAAGRSAEVAALLDAVTRPTIRSIEIHASHRDEGVAFAAHALSCPDWLRHRTLVVSTSNAFEAAQSSPERLILIDDTPDGRLRLPAGAPHVVIRSTEWSRPDASVPQSPPGDQAVIHLRLLAPPRLHDRLRDEGWPPDAVHKAVRAATNGFLALRGILSAPPSWARRETLADVWPALVLGESPKHGGPLGVVLRRLGGAKVERVVDAAEALAHAEPMALEDRSTMWGWRTPIDTWRQTERHWLNGNAPRILDTAEALLVSEDAEPIERSEADALIRALALIRWSPFAAQRDKNRAEHLAGTLVTRALASPSAACLETLAETAPGAFLDALDPEALKRHRLPVLWALERLSWAPERLSWGPALFVRVVDRLLMLADADDGPHGGLGNSPLSSLHAILRTRWAATGGECCRRALDSADERGASTRALAAIQLGLLPRPSGAMWMGLGPPEFMEGRNDAPAEGAPGQGRMTDSDLEWLVHRLVKTAERDFSVWPSLLNALSPILGLDVLTQCLDALGRASREGSLEPAGRRRVRGALRKHLADAKTFRDAWWSFKGEAFEVLKQAYGALQSGLDDVRLGDIAWMFASQPDHLDGMSIREFSGYADFEAENLRRAEASLLEVVNAALRRGEHLFQAAELAEFDEYSAARLGWAIAAHAEWSDSVAREIWNLDRGPVADGLRAGYLRRLDVETRLHRLEELLRRGDIDIAQPLLRELPAEEAVLRWLATCPEPIQAAWWEAAPFDPWSEDANLATMLLSGLLARGGARQILESLPADWPERMPSVRAQATHLRAALSAVEAPTRPDIRFSEVVAFGLDVLEASGAQVDELVALELKFLPLRDDLGPLPERIRRALESSPAFAAAVVRETFSPDGEETRLQPESNLGRIGQRVVFGLNPKFLPEALPDWADAFVAQCRATGHTVGCADFLGHILGNLASDPGEVDLWPPPVAREILKRHDSERLRRAIARAHFNRQGVREIDPHDPAYHERILAETLENSARRLGTQWPESARLCTMMAASYRESAELETRRR
jgi:transcriptional regulator with XRE-family HTH domain